MKYFASALIAELLSAAVYASEDCRARGLLVSFDVSINGAAPVNYYNGYSLRYTIDQAMPFDITFTAVPDSGTIEELIADCGFYWDDAPLSLDTVGVVNSISNTGSVMTQTINGPVDRTYSYL